MNSQNDLKWQKKNENSGLHHGNNDNDSVNDDYYIVYVSYNDNSNNNTSVGQTKYYPAPTLRIHSSKPASLNRPIHSYCTAHCAYCKRRDVEMSIIIIIGTTDSS